jgi:STE24 endopeptidase
MRKFVAVLFLATAGMAIASAVQANSPPATAAAEGARTAASSPAVNPVKASSARLDPAAETQKYMERLKGEAREKSDNYFTGKYWLTLWQFLYGLAVAWLLLSQRISLKMREFAERFSRRPNVQALLYGLMYAPVATLAMLPMTIYVEYFREHQFGLSNLTFVGWVMESAKNLLIETILMSIVVLGLYAILRRAPRTWWAWAAVAGGAFMVVMVMIAPVFIAPLFNTYKPLPDGPLREDILAMARANGIPADNVYWFDASKQSKRVSANVSGMFGTTRIALNDNLLNRMKPDAIKAVMGHEMGHYVLNHGPKHVIAFALILLGGLVFIKFAWDWAFARFGTRAGIRGLSDPAGFPLFGAILSVYMLVATPMSNTVIRTAETEADLFGLNAAREPDGFAEAIFSLSEYRKMQPGLIEEALFFDHPSGYNRIFSAMRWKAENPK